jgi:hypothetical protein
MRGMRETSAVFTSVTMRNFPAVFSAFMQIDLDNGAVNRYEPAATSYDVPEPWIAVLREADSALKSLTEEHLEEFCCGEYSDALEIAAQYGIPESVNGLLNAYFNGWIEG